MRTLSLLAVGVCLFAVPLAATVTVPSLPPPLRRVTCRTMDERIYVLSAREASGGMRWQLAMTRAGTGQPTVPVYLPNARPAITGDTATLSYRSANGGIIVELKVTTTAASLDVYVSYELEVNVDADLDPAVEDLSTHGNLTDVTCEIGQW